MKACDVMVSPVITVKPDLSVKELAQLLVDKRISAVPVVGDEGKLLGMVSEGDLIHRAEAGTERSRSWWLRLITTENTFATDYIKAHAHKVADLMTRNVITATPETPIGEIAMLMEKNAVKRIPIVQDSRLVGIVSRANLVQAIASAPKRPEIALSDTTIRDKLLAHLKAQPWAHTHFLNVTVSDGVVNLWGMTSSDLERKAIRVAAEGIQGVRAVNDNILIKRTLYET